MYLIVEVNKKLNQLAQNAIYVEVRKKFASNVPLVLEYKKLTR